VSGRSSRIARLESGGARCPAFLLPFPRAAPRTSPATSTGYGSPRGAASRSADECGCRLRWCPRVGDGRARGSGSGSRARFGCPTMPSLRPGATSRRDCADLLPVGAVVLTSQPRHHAPPGVFLEVAECLLGHRVPEVVGPAAQHRVVLAQQVLQRVVRTLSGDRFHLGLIKVSDRFATQA
jgi:hypothetical protein